jgi:hypothetical protein
MPSRSSLVDETEEGANAAAGRAIDEAFEEAAVDVGEMKT